METAFFVLIGMGTGFLAGRILKDRPLDLAADMTVGAFCALLGGEWLQAYGVLVPGTMLDALLLVAIAFFLLLFLSFLSRSPLLYNHRLRPHA